VVTVGVFHRNSVGQGLLAAKNTAEGTRQLDDTIDFENEDTSGPYDELYNASSA
jgi:hypothetical protein